MADEKSDDILSLEDLLREDAASSPGGAVAGAPVPQQPGDAVPSASPTATAPATAATPAPKNDDGGDLDRLLADADPEFAAQMKDISDLTADGVAIDADIESVVERERKEAATKGFKKIVLLLVKRPMRRLSLLGTQVVGFGKWVKEFGLPAAITGLKSGLVSLKNGIAKFVGVLKAGIGWFKAQPRKSKALMFGALLLGGVAIAVARFTLTEGIFPNFDVAYLTTFETVADAKYTIEKDEPWTDLNDPLLHPEHVVLIERIISNLRSTGPGSNPMALIDLYVESANQDVAIELKNREAEARDAIGTTLLQMTYEELGTEAGKIKLKVFLRKNLNEVLSTGRVRRVYFKSIIVKP
ncbi:MAG: flagellar basal body-associated FliL family protein [Bdellovibrionota bacterium]